MEVKINKEIRDYTESVYFGLSLRQFIFSIAACLVAVLLYFVFKPYFGIETLSWLCILGAAPFAAIGFVKYNGMNAEEFVLAYIRSGGGDYKYEFDAEMFKEYMLKLLQMQTTI